MALYRPRTASPMLALSPLCLMGMTMGVSLRIFPPWLLYALQKVATQVLTDAGSAPQPSTTPMPQAFRGFMLLSANLLPRRSQRPDVLGSTGFPANWIRGFFKSLPWTMGILGSMVMPKDLRYLSLP